MDSQKPLDTSYVLLADTEGDATKIENDFWYGSRKIVPPTFMFRDRSEKKKWSHM